MKICIAHGGDLSTPSGGNQRIISFASTLQSDGHEVTIVQTDPKEDFPSRLSSVEIVTTPIRARGVIDQPARAFLIARKAQKIARNTGAHLQIEHSTLGGMATLLGSSGYLLDMLDLAYPSPVYGNLPFGEVIQPVVRWFEGRAVRKASHVVVVSEQMRDMIIKEWDVPENKFTVIPNGYFKSRLSPFKDIKSKEGRVVFMGTLHPKVDIDTIIAAAQLPEVDEMVIVGDGPQTEALKSKITQTGTDNIELTGWLPYEEALEITATAALVINPQYVSKLQRASSPVKLYSYAALGLPMVLTDGPDAARWLSDEGAAELVAPDGDFLDKVQSVLRNESKRRRMSQYAEEAASVASWSNRSKQLSALYD